MYEQVQKKLEHLLEKTYKQLADLEVNLACTFEPTIQEEYLEKIEEHKQLIEKLELQPSYSSSIIVCEKISKPNRGDKNWN